MDPGYPLGNVRAVHNTCKECEQGGRARVGVYWNSHVLLRDGRESQYAGFFWSTLEVDAYAAECRQIGGSVEPGSITKAGFSRLMKTFSDRLHVRDGMRHA
jgi:hypothetical protein